MPSTLEFLGWIFQRCEIGNINLRFLGGKFPQNEFLSLSDLAENPSLIDAILRDHVALNCYYAPALRNGANGRKNGITQISVLWVDDPPLDKMGLLGLVWVILGIFDKRSKHFETKIFFILDAISPTLNHTDLVIQTFHEPKRYFVFGMAIANDSIPVAFDHSSKFLKRFQTDPA